MKRICVYCSANKKIHENYLKDAQTIAEMIALKGYDLVYGGSDLGLMGIVSSTAKMNGAKVYGIMPEKIYGFIEHEGSNCDEFILTENMRDRKEKMDKMSDAVIALAGGFGTLDEVIEIVDLKNLGYNSKPIVFLNTNNYYNELFKFFDKVIDENFARKQVRDLYYLAQTPQEVFEYLENYVPSVPPKTVDDIYVK
ncbi:TIGR00730 family Rossman fold protein [bacterium]|nr:TIGR00730 family Rossman fold protein [bacterium]